MQAIVWHGPNTLKLVEMARPTPGPGQALIRTAAVGVCGSDIHGYTGESGRRTPGMVMGHEIAGVVEALGGGSDDAAVGDRVAVNPLSGCGECEYCLRGDEHICPRRTALGVTPDAPGGFAEYVVAPTRNLAPLPEGVSFFEGAMAEPFAVALHAAALSGLKSGDSTVIVGGGAIGLCLLLACQARGIGPVFLTEMLPHRLELAASLGAEALPADEDPVSRVLEATGGMGVPASLEAVGIGPTVRTALQVVRPGGRAVLVGLANPTLELSLYDLVPRERALLGSYAYTPEEYREAVQLIASSAVDVRPLVERAVPLAETDAAFRDLASGVDHSVKVMIEPQADRLPN